jgi:hypothetical protein
VAALIDDQVVRNYRLHPSNHFAVELLQSVAPPVDETEAIAAKRREFLQRLEAAPEQLRSLLLQQYANPVLVRQQLAG